MKLQSITVLLLSVISVTASILPTTTIEERLDSLNSTAPDLILVSIGSQSNQSKTILLEHRNWWSKLEDLEKRKYSKEEFIEYMKKNEGKTIKIEDGFEIDSNDLAVLTPEHLEMKKKGKQWIFENFYKLQDWHDIFPEKDIYKIDLEYDLGLEGEELKSLARLFIESGFRVYRDCETGSLGSMISIPKSLSSNKALE